MNKNQKAITLIALIITIVILIILAGISIILSQSESIIKNAQKAELMSEMAKYKEDLELYKSDKITENKKQNKWFEGATLNASGLENSLDYNTKLDNEKGNIKTVIPQIKEKYCDGKTENGELVIVNGQLQFISNNDEEIKIVQGLGIIAGKHIQTSTTIAKDGTIICDSLMQGIRDVDLKDGTYTFEVNGRTSEGKKESKDYKVELINYKDDVTYSLDEGETNKTISLGDTSTDYKMLVVKYHKNLTINEGVTLTASMADNSTLTYKKGMYLCVLGTLENKGTISMTARGTNNLEGENVYLWKNDNGSYEYVPAVGGAGGESVTGYSSNASAVGGNKGTDGINRKTGGGRRRILLCLEEYIVNKFRRWKWNILLWWSWRGNLYEMEFWIYSTSFRSNER